MADQGKNNTVKQLKRKLVASKTRFKNVIERNADGIIIVDQEGIIRYLNPAAERFFGFQAESMVQESFGYPLVAGEQTEIEIVNQGGKRLIAEMRAVNTSWEGEDAYLLSLRDITHRKRNERITRESLRRARYIQDSLFPASLPEESGLSFAGTHQHAEHVGGDYYYLHSCEDRIFFVVADVTGNGLDAALITVFASSFFRRRLEENCLDDTPLDILKGLHSDFNRQGFPDDYSLEVFLGFIFPSTMKISYAVSGAIRSLLIDAEGKISRLKDSTGMVINNTISEPYFGHHSLHLSPNQALIIYTDGVDEPFYIKDPREGQNHLPEIIYKTIGLLPLDEILERIVGDTLFNLDEESPADDMAVLGIGRQLLPIKKREWSFNRSLEKVSASTDELCQAFIHLPLDIHHVRMALQEALTNIAEHSDGEGEIRVDVYWDDRRLVCIIGDNGSGFDWRSVLSKREDPLSAMERGRGMTIIEMAAESFTLNDAGNKIAVGWNLDQKEKRPAV